MKVELKAYTNVDNILDFIGEIAGTCTGKSGLNNEKRAIRCIRSGHTSVLEHVSFTWRIEGISRACSHQLVRHRVAAYTQESQRYVKLDDENEWYVMPPVYESMDSHDGRRIGFENQMLSAASEYYYATEDGVRPEDARYMLPTAAKTNIWVTMNLREFLHFYRLRTDKSAQWEIHGMASEMMYAAARVFPEITEIAREYMKEGEN